MLSLGWKIGLGVAGAGVAAWIIAALSSKKPEKADPTLYRFPDAEGKLQLTDGYNGTVVIPRYSSFSAVFEGSVQSANTSNVAVAYALPEYQRSRNIFGASAGTAIIQFFWRKPGDDLIPYPHDAVSSLTVVVY